MENTKRKKQKEEKSMKYIRFDWAMKRLLRDKANYVVLEGFLSVLLGESVYIKTFLESEGNQQEENDKYNRVDILCEDSLGKLIIIEVQNERAFGYFHRMLYGTSKVITEYIQLGEDYDRIKKVYSVNIVYFQLGQGTDYVYHGKTEFRGLHTNDILQLSKRQMEMFHGKDAGDIFPEYYVLKVNDFDKTAKTPLDEWISFLKTGDIDDHYTAQGLPEARERLRIDSLSDRDRRAYYREMENRMAERDVLSSAYIDGHAEGKEHGLKEGLKEGRKEGIKEGRKEGIKEGIKEGTMQIARNMRSKGFDVNLISDMTGLTVEVIENL
jgi:predicted transposase/invertase (TIGR01784 family)